MSLGRCGGGHRLLPKLSVAAAAGFRGVEIFEEDLIAYAQAHLGSDSFDAMLAAAHDVHAHCKSIGLVVVCLQPFRFYEGLTDPAARAAKIDEWARWLKIARALHTELLSVASTFCLPDGQTTGDLDVLANDLGQLADMAAAEDTYPPLRVSYEALAWGTHVDTWEKSWEVVVRADRPNLGICLDTFNIGARIYADPTAPDGRNADADTATQASIARITQLIDPAKVFNVQLVDGERLDAPLLPGHPFYDASQPSRMSWSRNCRLFYGEQSRGAYLPVLEICRAIFEGLGYRGWVSMELFSRSCAAPGTGVVPEHAQRGIASWHALCEDMDVDLKGDDQFSGPFLGASELQSSSKDWAEVTAHL